MEQYLPFKKATPVWAEGLAEEKNCTLGLYTAVNGGKTATLRIAIETINYALNSFCYIRREGFVTVSLLPVPNRSLRAKT